MEDRTALGTSDGNDGRGRDDAVSDPTKQTENAVYADVGSPKQRQRPNGEAGASAPNDSDVRPPDAAGGVPNAAGNNDTNTNANTNTIKAKEVTPLTGGQRTRVQHSNSDLRLCLTARKRLEESGTLRGIKRRLGEALDSCGWKDELRALCRKAAKHKGIVTVDDVVQEVSPMAYASIPVPWTLSALRELKEALSDGK